MTLQSDKTGQETANLCLNRINELQCSVEFITSDAGPENASVVDLLHQHNHKAFWIKDPCHGLDHVCTEGADVLHKIGSFISKFKIVLDEAQLNLSNLNVVQLKDVCKILNLTSGGRKNALLARLHAFTNVRSLPLTSISFESNHNTH